MPSFFQNTKSMTGRLAVFFTLVAIVVGIFCVALISLVLTWSEDRVGERRIMIDKQQAIQYFLAHPKETSVQLDTLTSAFHGWQDVPAALQTELKDQGDFLGEAGEGEDSRMILSTTFTLRGAEQQLILVSRIEEIEITQQEFINVIAIVLGLVVLLIGAFTAILTRISKSLIRPVNDLCEQLEQHQGNIHHAFQVPSGAAQEFQTLTQTLNQYRTEMDQLIKREQAFARYASHELRTPLTVMKGSSSLLAKETSTPFAKRQLGRIQHATEQMLTMVDALLGLVRYEKSQTNAPLRTIEASEILNIVQKNQAQADAKKLQLRSDIHGSPMTQATPAILEMVLGNLLRNSIAASSSGDITVSMTDTSITVTDEGEGYAPSENSTGHGLGLLIVQDLCQRYGWGFSIRNRTEGGCEATLRLPVITLE